MDRFRGPGRWRAAAILAAAVMVSQTGCIRTLATMLYVFKDNNVAAEFKGLKDKRVAVVCRPLEELEWSTSSAPDEIASAVSRLLAEHIRKIDVIDPRDVAQWTDEHNWDDFTEIGEALKADLVLGIDLERFSLYQGQTLYQGRAQATITVYDTAAGGEVIYQKQMRQSVYPPNTGIPTQDKPEDEFRRQFIGVLADEIGRHFYPHDSRADFAKDTTALD